MKASTKEYIQQMRHKRQQLRQQQLQSSNQASSIQSHSTKNKNLRTAPSRLTTQQTQQPNNSPQQFDSTQPNQPAAAANIQPPLQQSSQQNTNQQPYEHTQQFQSSQQQTLEQQSLPNQNEQPISNEQQVPNQQLPTDQYGQPIYDQQPLIDENGQPIPSTAFRESELFPGQFNPIPEETVLEWTAPNRPFKKRDRQFYTTITAIVFLISLILFFAGQFILIAVVISVAFLSYVSSSVPPQQVKNKITTWGIRIEDQIFFWDELGRYWFEERYGQKMILIETIRFPNRITLMLATQKKDDVEQLLSEVLIQQKPLPTGVDKAAQWLQEKLPLEGLST